MKSLSKMNNDNDLVTIKYLKDNISTEIGGGIRAVKKDINSHVNFFEKSTDNANDLPNGWSLVGRLAQNVPADAWFWIESISLGRDSLQRAYGKDSISLRYIRIKSNGVWKDWEKL